VRPTTPRLEAIRDDLIVFDRVTSNATMTIFAVPLALTRATPASWHRVLSEKTIIGLLRQGGYQVYWISNQEHYGLHDVPASAIALEANSASFPEDVHSASGVDRYDSNLLPRMREVLARLGAHDKAVIFLHTMGSHYLYRDRYPKEFDAFRSLDNLPRRLQAWQMQAINEYDNSVYFTDYIVRAVIDELATRDGRSALLYFSDHGERLYDCGLAGGYVGHGFPIVSRQEIEIPFFLWLSTRYRDANPDLVERLEANRHATAELHSLFETVVDLVGLDYDGRAADTSLFAKDFSPPLKLQALNSMAQPVSPTAEDAAAQEACVEGGSGAR